MSGPIDYTNKDFASLRQALLEYVQVRLPEMTDLSANDPGVVLLELFAAMGDSIFYDQDRKVNESYLDTAVERRSVLNHLRLIGYELRAPVAASADLTLLFNLNTTTSFDIAAGATFTTTADATGAPVSFQYVRPVSTRIDMDKLDVITYRGVEYKAYRTLPVVQIDQVVFDEVIGSSDGSLGQQFVLAHKPMILGSLVLSVDEGGPSVAIWTRTNTLLYSQSGDPHFLVLRDENDNASIVFGDNVHGKVPRRGQDNIVASYLVGGGAKGNVPAMTISKVMTLPLPSDVKLAMVFNENAANGGADAEPIADAVLRGPQQLRSYQRAVTAADFEQSARLFGVAKARAFARSWNLISISVAPFGGGLPTDTLKEDLRTYFTSKQMITTIVDFVDPTYIEVLIDGTVEVLPNYFNDQVQQEVVDAVKALWSFDNVNFEDTLYLSKLYEVIALIEGVAGTSISLFNRSDRATLTAVPSDGRLRFGPNEIPFCAGFRALTVTGGRRRG